MELGTKEFNDLAMEMFGGKPKQQTAVEWLQELIECGADLEQIKKSLPKAKEMEKQQQGYSEEDVLNILIQFCDNFYENSIRKDVIEKWFEQFKKK